jgi:F-type H+-transporting ATPase subunit gamma
MPSTITLKRRITSIKNTRQITKAMQLVSASKLRRAQEYANQSKAYHELAQSLMIRLSNIKEIESQPLFEKREVKKRLYVIITSSSGLAGAYNANVLKLLTTDLGQFKGGAATNQVISVGNKGAQFVRRLKDAELIAVYPSFGDKPTANDIRPLLNTIIDSYKKGDVDEVRLIYTIFNSTISQKANDGVILPAQKLETTEDLPNIYNFEPDIESVVDQVATRLIEAEIWQAILESLASEHAMRMVAMKNATDNAKDLIDDYTLELNTARQAGITQELAEISGGVEALKGQ